MTKKKELKPYINIGAGHILRRNLNSLGWTQEDLAQVTDISEKTISKIINNKQRITVDTSKLLSKAFETSPEYWLNLDNNYRLRLLEEDSKENSTQTKAQIRKYMPVSEIQKKGWSTIESSAEGYQRTFADVWHKSFSDFDKNVYEKESKYCARRSQEDEIYTNYYSKTWLQIAKNFAREIEVPKYVPEKLVALAEYLTTFTVKDKGVRDVVANLTQVGVKFFVQSHLSKTYLDGACFLDGPNPVIVYTARHDRVDNFWFTLSHEIAHVIRHLPKSAAKCFLDDLDTKKSTDIEKDADEYTEQILRVDEIMRLAAPHFHYFSNQNLIDISTTLKIEPSLVLGILQYHGYVEYRKLNTHKRKVKELIPAKYLKG